MKKALKSSLAMLLALAALAATAQISDRRVPGQNGYTQLTAACTNASTTCDVAGSTQYGPNGDVLGPATLEFNTQSYGLAVIYINGNSTASGGTISFEFSDDGGTNWYQNTCARTDSALQESSEAVPASVWRAFDCAIGAATRMRVRVSAISSGFYNMAATLTTGLMEPAQSVAFGGMLSTPITTSTNTQIKATPVFLHTLTITQPGATSNSITVVDTTAANCSGGTTLATIPSAQLVAGMAPVTLLFDVTTANGLCVITAGTTPPQLLVTSR